MRRLFLDVDGVLADFDKAYLKHFGHKIDRSRPDPPGMWDNIRSNGSFYRDLELMPDAKKLLEGTKKYSPTLLTGAPFNCVPDAERQKREWAAEHIGNIEVICSKSHEKRLHGKPGDVLVDDWNKYQYLWEEMGGIFILHTSAEQTLAELEKVMK